MIPYPYVSSVCRGRKLLVLLLLLPGAVVSAGPRLHISPASADFGTQTRNLGTYDFVFTLKNTGDAPLLIETVRTGCSCTTVSLAAQELPPGTETELRGQLLTRNYEGSLSKTITIQCNDGSRPKTEVEVKVRLPYKEPGIYFWPRTANVYAAMQPDGLQARFWLEDCDATGKTKITKIVLPKGWTCEPAPPLTLQAGERQAFVLKLPRPEAETFRDGRIVVHTNHAMSGKVEGSLVTTRPAR